MSGALADRAWAQIKAHERLPSPSAVAQQVLALAGRDDVDVPEIARVMQADPALTGALVRLANSPALRGRRPMLAVEDAVLRLGFNGVRQVALAVSVLDAYRDGGAAGIASRFDCDAFWGVSLGTAIGCELTAGCLRVIAPEEAFSLGLLSRIGMLALAVVYPGAYDKALAAAPDPERRIEVELDLFSIDHLDLSRRLLIEWGVPERLAVAVAAWYRPTDPPPGDLRARRLEHLVHIGALCGVLFRGERTLNNIGALGRAIEAVGLTDKDQEEIFFGAFRRWDELAPACGIDPTLPEWLRPIAADAHRHTERAGTDDD